MKAVYILVSRIIFAETAQTAAAEDTIHQTPGASNMLKIALTTATLVVAACTSAMAETKSWNVTEQSASGIKSAQGVWSVITDGNNKITGNATMQFDNGNTLEYTLEGSMADSVYTVNLGKRTDGKNGCVWTGKSSAQADPKSSMFVGDVLCDGNTKFYIKAAF